MATTFFYKARGSAGQILEGMIEAGSREEVAGQLRDKNLYAIKIEAQAQAAASAAGKTSLLNFDLAELSLFAKGYKIAELANFAQRLSVLIAAGIPLVRSINIIKKQSNVKHEQQMLTEVLTDIEAGATLSNTLQKFPRYFPTLFVQLIKAGETGGVLDSVLAELVEYYRNRDRINKEVKSALYYPVVIVIVAIAAVFILMGFVLPNILNMLLSFGGEIPLPTKILMAVSNFIAGYWWLILLTVIGAGILIRNYFKSPVGKHFRDQVLLKIPVLGDLIRKVAVSRFASTLSLLLQSGVNIVNALPVVEEVVGNEVFADVLLETRLRIREGTTLSEPIQKSGEFPPMVVQMLKVGEESGNIEDMLNKVSDYYDLEVANAIEGSISLIEPAMIIILAVIVGGIVAATILPLFAVYQSI